MVSFTKTKPIITNKREPIIDMDRIAKEMREDDENGHLRFAPPDVRKQADPSNLITSFGELPTKELDEIIFAAEAEVSKLKAEAQDIRNMYVERTQNIVEEIKRLREGVRLSMETLNQLREQCIKLNKPLNEVLEEEKHAQGDSDKYRLVRRPVESTDEPVER